MSRQGSLGEFEQLVLLAVMQLAEDAYGARISEELESKAGRRVSRGALYSALDRLERKDFLTWRIEGSTPDRGGLPRRRFRVTRDGVDALREYRDAVRRLSSGLDDLLGEVTS